MQPNSPADPAAQPPNQRPKRPKLYGPGRPRILDDAKRREICALIAGGCGLREAARYVHCSTTTIRREAERNPDFSQQLRRSEAYAQLSPLRAMQQAVGTHWRAAAWMLERAFPERFARPEPGAFGARQARQLMGEVLHVVSSEIADPFKYDRLEKRIRGTFEYHIRSACDRRRTTRNLRRAMKFFEEKDRLDDPLAQFGIQIPDFDSFFRPKPTSSPTPADDGSPAPADPAPVGHGSPDFSAPVGRGSPDPAHPSTEGLPTNEDRPATFQDLENILRRTIDRAASARSATPTTAAPNNH